MARKINVITGATGLLGSYIAEHLVQRNDVVRAFVRTTSDTAFLQQLGVEVIEGDLRDPRALSKAVVGADVVYHCAAHVSDWGPWQTYYRGTVETTRNVVVACRSVSAGRLVHVSSVSVYGYQNKICGEVDETSPIGRNHWLWDHYGRSKVMAESEVRTYPNHTIIRPGWFFGERDRVTIPRIVQALRLGRARIIGSGQNSLNILFATDIAAGTIMAANQTVGKGQTYNLCSRGEITQRDLLDVLCEELALPRVRQRVPTQVAWSAAFAMESITRMLRRRRPPVFTRRAIYMIGRPTRFSIRKAETELGWQPQITPREGIKRALSWYLDNEAKHAEGKCGMFTGTRLSA